MSKFTNDADSKPISGITTRSTATRPIRVIPGGKDFFLKRDINGEMQEAKTQEDLTRDIHNQLKGCGRFREATIYMVNPDTLDKYTEQAAYIKEFPPMGNPKQMPWELTTSSLKDVAKMIAAVLFNNHDALYFRVSIDGILASRDKKRKFSEAHKDFQPTISYTRRTRVKNDYNAFDEANTTTF